ncbi:MAG: lactonase family protein [Acidobacteriaceae bacterium]
MKWSQYGRPVLALVASLALGLSITACNPSFTLGFVYALAAKNNVINAYTIDSVTGALTQAVNSPFASGGVTPIAAVADNRSKWLYVVHEGDASIVQFTIALGGGLQSVNTYKTPGLYPVGVVLGPKQQPNAVQPNSQYLFVLDAYAPPYAKDSFTALGTSPITPPQDTTSTQTQGCVAVYPISYTDGSLGTPVKDPVSGMSCFPVGAAPAAGSLPIGLTVTAFVNYLYVADQGTHSVYGYSVDYATGILTALPAANNSFQAGVKPSAIVSDPSGRFVYVTDEYLNQIEAYNILGNGTLQDQVNGPFTTDLFPTSIVADPRGFFLYVTNYNSNDVRAYTINQATGNPTSTAGGTYGAGTAPTCVVIEPAYGRYVYTSNYLDNTVSGYELNPHTGALTQALNTPFATSEGPACVATVANGAHPLQTIIP